MRINHNIQALNAYSKLSKNQTATGKALEKLSSGLRINRAADDAAGLAISEKMRGQIRGLQQAEKNAMDGISLIQTAEGALGEVHDMLSRMRELSVQAANGTLTPPDRAVIQDEIDQLRQQIDRAGNDTQFNTKKLLNGSLSENADIRSLYGTVSYSKNSTGLRNIAVDTASVLPQDIYSLNVVTTSKIINTTAVNGTNDPYKTGMENVLLSPDSELASGDYKIELSATMGFAASKYDNAVADITTGKLFADSDKATLADGNYRIEYNAVAKKISAFKNGTEVSLAATDITGLPITATDINKQIKITSASLNSVPITFNITDGSKNAKIEFEKQYSKISGADLNVDISNSSLEDGYYIIDSDTSTGKASLYRSNGQSPASTVGAPLQTITLTASGTQTFSEYNVTIPSPATGKVQFKQGTEYTMTVKDSTGAQKAKKTSIEFGDEAINFREYNVIAPATSPTYKSMGLTVDFTNAATGYVKRGGKLPVAPATGTPYFSFNINELKRTSVILKDKSDKVIAHQFVDNDRKFIELGNTGISFGTGVLSDGEKATNIDIRQNLENSSVTFQIGTNAGEIVALGIGDIRTKALGIDKFRLTDETSASNAIAVIDGAIDKVSAIRSKLGAYQNRMEHTVNSITQANENLTAAESRIRDADMAKEMTEFTKLNIINQSATAMLAQANQLPQGVLQLLKG